MQSVFRSTFVGVLALAALTACGDKSPNNVGTVQSIQVTPQSATVNVGGTFTFVANVTATGSAARTVTWTTGDQSIATVDQNGVVTGVKAGNTSVIATSTADNNVKGAASITVGAVTAPTVSIASINHTVPGTGSVPVDQSNVSGQIDVLVNLDAGDQKVSSISLIMSCNGKDTTVQTQTISSGDVAPIGADEAASTVPFSFNTGAFNPATGAVAFQNGVCTIKASAVTSSGTVVASSGEQLTLNNTDFISVGAITTTPSAGQVASASDATGLQWRAGAVNVTAVPVVFSAGRSVASATFNLVNLSGGNALGKKSVVIADSGVVATIGGVTPTSGVLTASFPNSTSGSSGSTAVGGATVKGLGVSVNTVDNSGNPGPAAVATTTNSIRLDNTAPDTALVKPTWLPNQQNTTGGWVGKNFVFSTSGTGAPINLGSAGGDTLSGVKGVDNVVDTTQFAIGASTTFTNFSSVSSLAETSSGSTNTLRLKICDALGNCTTFLPVGATFGVDLTAPSLSEVANAVPADQSVFNFGSTPLATAAFAVTDTSGTPGITASGSNGVLAQVQGLVPGSGTSSATICPVGNHTGSGSAVTCTSPSAQPLTFSIPNTAGEYSMLVEGVDQAGNVSAPITVHYYVDQTPPLVAGGVAVPASITTGAQFTSTATDNMDVAAGNGNLQFTGVGVKFAESGTGSPTGVVFDNSLTRSSTITVTLNTFYRSLSSTLDNATPEKPETAGIRAVDAAGNLAASQAVTLPATNIANGAPFSSSDAGVGIKTWTIAADSAASLTSGHVSLVTASAQALSATSGSPFTQVCFYEVSQSGAEGGVAGPGGSAAGELFLLGCTGAETTTLDGGGNRILNYSINFTGPTVAAPTGFQIRAIGQNAGGDGLISAPVTINVVKPT
jgi:Big-like domain-containing protein